MDFNLPKYKEYFSNNNVNQSENTLPTNYLTIETNWINDWEAEYNSIEDNDNKYGHIYDLIIKARSIEEKYSDTSNKIKSIQSQIDDKHLNFNKINKSSDNIENNFLLGEQRLLESKGIHYINNYKYYIFIIIIIILLLIQLLLILL